MQLHTIGRLIEQEQVRLDEQSSGQGDSHSPSTRHVLRRLLHHLLVEAETGQDSTGLCLERAGVEILQLLVLELEADLVDIVGDGHLLDLLLDTCDLLSCTVDDEVDGSHFGRLSLALYEVDLRWEQQVFSHSADKPTRDRAHINVIRNLDVSLSQRLQEGGLESGSSEFR